MTKKTLFRIIAALLCVIILLSMAGCGNGDSQESAAENSPAASGISSGEEQSSSKDTLVIGLSAEPTGFDNTGNTGTSFIGILQNLVSDTLLDYDEETDSFLPRLATEWSYTDDLHFEITLRDDVKFSTGEPLTTSDVLYSLKRLAESPMQMASFASFDLDATVITDDTHMTLVLNEPFAPLLYLLSNTATIIVSEAYMEEVGTEAANLAPVGSGAFVVSEWTTGEGMTLTPNEYYWGDELAYNTVEVRFIGENATRFMELQTGGVDIIDTPSTTDIASILSGSVDGVELYMNPGYDQICWAFNQDDPVFADRNVRLAIAHAINYEQVVSVVYGESGSVPSSCLGTGTFGKIELGTYEYNPDLSKQYLAEAGYADGLEIKAVVASDGMYSRLAEVCQEMLRQANITLTIETYDHGTTFAAYMNGEATMGFMELKANMLDPSKVLDPLRAGGAMKLTATKDEELESLLAAGLSTVDETERAAIYAEIQQIVYDNAYLIPLVDYAATFVTADYVEGFHGSTTMIPDLRTVSFSS